MTVPFEKIGPGQSARLAYQVMGNNGPIFNPSGIRYLPAESAGLSENAVNSGGGIPPLAGALTSLSVVNLAASVGAMAFSAAAVREVQRLREEVRDMVFLIKNINIRLSDLRDKIQRVDARVAEVNLRESLNHLLATSVDENEINLTRLSKVAEDIGTFATSLDHGIVPCRPFGLRLSTDVTDKLNIIYDTFYSIRHQVYSTHNSLPTNKPTSTLAIDQVEDYFTTPDETSPRLAVSLRRVFNQFLAAKDNLGQLVYDDFSFATNEDSENYKNWYIESTINPLLINLSDGDRGAIRLAYDFDIDTSNLENAVQQYNDLRLYWLWHTSGGLLWRTLIEAIGVSQGYEHIFPMPTSYPDPIDHNSLSFNYELDQESLQRITGHP